MNNTNHKPSHVMAQLEKLGWVKNFQPAIKGQYTFLPRGTVTFTIMAEFLKNWVRTELASLEIRTPILYDWSDERIQAESASFETRVFQSNVDDKTSILRPGGDYGVMSMLSNNILSENHLPISLFELATSFRKGQSRELAGLLKARAFTLLDHHTFTATPEQAWEAYRNIIISQAKLGDFFGFDWQINLQIEKNFLVENQHQLSLLDTHIKKPIHKIILENQTNYWIMQHHFVDETDGISFSDGQYDCINAKNYQITYSNTSSNKNYLIICHASFDSVERWLFKLVSAAIDSEGFQFPLWLSPVHMRLIPYNAITLTAAKTIQQQAAQHGIRIDIDSREKSIADRIKQAKNDWIPFTVLFPDNFSDTESPLIILTLDNNKTSWQINQLFEHIQLKIQSLQQPFFTSSYLDSIIGKPSLR